MRRLKRQLNNVLEVTINPATEDTLSSLALNTTLASPSTVTPVAISDVATSHTITVGKKNLDIQNTGSKIVAWGGSTITFINGIKMTPMQAWEFKNCTSGFKIYFICNTGETSTIRICEM